MEQIDTAVKLVARPDFPAGTKLTRQLDFKTSVNENVMLPEHPQARLQSKLIALAQSNRLRETQLLPPLPPQAVAPERFPRHKVVMAQPESQARTTRLDVSPVTMRFAHVESKPVSRPSPKLNSVSKESPKSRQWCDIEQKDRTPKKQRHCNCKNSRCLKMYCECFASGSYCDGCNCTNCHNNIENETDRQIAVEAILERKPDAFRPKIASPPGAIDSKEEAGEVMTGGKHNKGCNCKRTWCLKKYCECFRANILCSDNCKCMDCKNFEGSEERNHLFHVYPENLISLRQWAAINEAIGPSGFGNAPCEKSGNVLGMISGEKYAMVSKFSQGTHSMPNNASQFHAYFCRARPASVTEPSKSFYRSPLVGIIEEKHVKYLCSLLVIVSSQARKAVLERNGVSNKTNLDQSVIPVASLHGDGEDGQNPEDARELCEDQSLREMAGSDIQNEQPKSPETLALMCDERDLILMMDDTPSKNASYNSRPTVESPSKHGLEQSYAEQERLILTSFRGFLETIITRGSMKETKVQQEANKDFAVRHRQIHEGIEQQGKSQ